MESNNAANLLKLVFFLLLCESKINNYYLTYGFLNKTYLREKKAILAIPSFYFIRLHR